MKRRVFLIAFSAAGISAVAAFRRVLSARARGKRTPAMPLKELSREEIYSKHDMAG